MKEFLRAHRHEPDSMAIMLKSRYLDGWALLIPTKSLDIGWGPTAYSKKKSRYTFQVYVRESQRGKGYGHILINEAQKISRPLFVWPHDRISGGFYAQYKVVCTIDDRQEYLRKRKVC
jgi:GNAT superfamily N-acetyltransferase